MMIILLIAMFVAPALPSELKILDTPNGGTHPTPCTITCSGIGRWNESGDDKWGDSTWYPRKAYKIVDMSGCNFVSAPVVTSSTQFQGFKKSHLCPSITQLAVSKSLFYVYTVEDATALEMRIKECDIYWVATDYNC